MSDTINLPSVTQLIKDATGMSRGIVVHGKKTIAGVAYDKHKTLNAFVEDGDRKGAIEWLLSQEFADLQTAANRGSEIHRAAEAYALGVEPEYDPFLKPWVEQCQRFLEEFRPTFLMAEAPVYNLTVGYAGTLDGIAVIDGKTVVLDYKTTAWGPDDLDDRGKPRARPPFSDVALQLVLYRHAELVGLLADRKEIQWRRYYVFDPDLHTEPMPETEGAVCVVISPKDYVVVPVDTSERIWKASQYMLAVATYQTTTSKAVFGPPIQPPNPEAAPAATVSESGESR